MADEDKGLLDLIDPQDREILLALVGGDESNGSSGGSLLEDLALAYSLGLHRGRKDATAQAPAKG